MLAERADLTARLTLKDELSGVARRASSNFSSSMGKIRGAAAKGVRSTAANVGKIGLIASAAIGAAVKGGIDSLVELESATTSVDGAIKQMGLTGQVTSAQIAGWAQEIETSVGAAFDDKEITAAATTLIRFGKTTPQNLRPALTVMTDLATKTGSVDSAASLLAKAMADPIKAAGKLARVGIILTDEQQHQIAGFIKNGKVGKAQKVILDALAKSTKGAALASQGPFARSQAVLKDVVEDAQRALATGFLPVLMEVQKVLSDELAKPETLARIKEFGQGLASGLKGLIDGARGVDWGAIGGGLKTAAAGAKGILDAFLGMPDWIKTAVLTGWGLNKLTGGAVVDIGEILLKGAFGQLFARGASPANPMWVAAVGGLGGGIGGAAAGGLGLLGGIVIPVVAGAAVGMAIGNALEPITTKWFMENTRRDISEGGVYKKGGVLSHSTPYVDHSLGGRDDRAIASAIKAAKPTLKVNVHVSNSIRTRVYGTGTVINKSSTGISGVFGPGHGM